MVKADGQLQQAKSERQQTLDELETKQELNRRTPGNVAFREIERLQERERGQLGAITAATASKQNADERISALLPAEKATAEAELAQAQVELDKTVIRAGVSGRVEQFFLRVGDIVNPLMRPAGILIPEGAGYRSLQAGFGQIEVSDHEGRNDRGSYLRVQTIYDHPDGGDRPCRTTLPPGSFGVANSSLKRSK